MANSELFQTIMVSLESHAYPIYIGQHGLLNYDLLNQSIPSKQVLIVTNDQVAPLYLDPIQQALSHKQCDLVVLPDGEVFKNQDSLFCIYDKLIQAKHHRDTTLVALGGGVIGDITGFAASTYQRGVRFVQVPTTLLAQVDASVGGKTAINHPLGKNMIGSFYQPSAVIIDLSTLNTLSPREFRSGFAEIIKYGLLAGPSLLGKIDTFLATHERFQVDAVLEEIIAACCQIKVTFVIDDEKEQGSRALLNLGHTFAHAIEAVTQYQRFQHGEAVAIGLYCAARLSNDLGYASESVVHQLDRLLQKAGLPRRIPHDLEHAQLYELMMQDKKVKNQCARFILMRKPGDCFIDETVTQVDVQRVLANQL